MRYGPKIACRSAERYCYAVPGRKPNGRRARLSAETHKHDGAARAVIPVVGIGASAGGLDVFKLLLADLPADTGLAIVFMQHLKLKHHSMVADILTRHHTASQRSRRRHARGSGPR